MLESSLSVPAAVRKVQTAAPQPIRTVTGWRLAKPSSEYSPSARANDAAGWLEGRVAVRPTAKLACSVFSVSYARLRQAQARIEQRECRRRALNGNGTAPLGEATVERLIVQFGADRVLQALDRMTTPTPPTLPATQ
jgi:hypothetical protein